MIPAKQKTLKKEVYLDRKVIFIFSSATKEKDIITQNFQCATTCTTRRGIKQHKKI